MKLNLQHLGKKKLLTKNSSHVCNNEIKDGKNLYLESHVMYHKSDFEICVF
jgi:hypothetical protein